MSKATEQATLEGPPLGSEEPLSDVEALSGSQGPTDELEASETYSETFDREYVQGLRDQNAKLRVRSKKTDQMAQQLVTLLAEQTGRLHDASDLPYSEDLLDENGLPDAERVATAVDALVTLKPHLAKLRVVGDVGQGVQGQPDAMQSLGSMLKRAAG